MVLLVFDALECVRIQRKKTNSVDVPPKEIENWKFKGPQANAHTTLRKKSERTNRNDGNNTEHRCNKERRADNIFLAPSYF